jgi:hypothetical protein
MRKKKTRYSKTETGGGCLISVITICAVLVIGVAILVNHF